MRISDWSSDVCSSDLPGRHRGRRLEPGYGRAGTGAQRARALSEQRRAYYRNDACGALESDSKSSKPFWRGTRRARRPAANEIGRASGRERVVQYGSSSVVAVSLKKKKKQHKQK